MAKQDVKVAFVGLGPAGHFHLTSILQTEGVQLSWVIDHRQQYGDALPLHHAGAGGR